ncbi:hypothetical protein MCOR27_010521 [Pyricularia oryzae]|uniref:General transcription and DNA repair factor IIH subunit TFB5 n=5 Tax=Pyricularia TaxID=48558 RepID=A0ABQ8NHY7_PYRGI|nr:uncharacterized protein MGG_15089 [Pyricularia oryzae 70-15]ELQ34375.1 hypothetical protein OOU_Y34scaffold00768g19 [Pyricularia oryzae Y34]KAH8839920.1 hypothetical protein MCOR01_009088 [Pyricularia oryzae]KAI6297388.1 hypothetical protein MCOR33_006296 [Pyricularia grisea]TLD21272.1 hypothetical protein PspLS_09184 [Pyricularia sp. CBS 133598]EHA55734.1 hypothetical protein MGG_15089 [Pyricularia oryzae 70-15]
MPKAVHGVLITCDPSIKSIIVDINNTRNDIIVEDIDDTHLLIKESMVDMLKRLLDQKLSETQNDQADESSGSDSDKQARPAKKEFWAKKRKGA